MNKKTLIALISVAAVILIGIAAAVVVLFSDQRSPRQKRQSSAPRVELLDAIPTDAAAVIVGKSLDRFPDMFDSGFSSFLKDVSSDKDILEMASSAVVSLHFSGTLVPLMATYAKGHPEEEGSLPFMLASAAERNGLHSTLFEDGGRPIMLISPSQTILGSAVRHLENGNSICDDEDFEQCRTSARSGSSIFINLRFLDKLTSIPGYASMKAHSSFLKHFCAWLSISVEEIESGKASLRGVPYSRDSKASFSRVLDSGKPLSPEIAVAAPYSATDIVSIPLSSAEKYQEAYERYLDSVSELDRYRSNLAAVRKKYSKSVPDIVRDWGVSEIARVSWKSADAASTFNGVLFRKSPKVEIENDAKGCQEILSALFGKYFSVPDAAELTVWKDWVLISSAQAAADYVASQDRFKDCMSAAGCTSLVTRKTSVFVYHDLLQDLPLAGISLYPLVIGYSDGVLSADCTPVQVVQRKDGASSVMVAKVEVPSGPFTVYNSGTGKDCLLKQNANNSLSLTEMSGKGIWSIPFSDALCGAVETVDYYANGKKQFLFCAGSSVYMLDRLGRFVSGFPVDLGKQVLLGPAAYDFSGGGGYNIIVLHADNTVCMYNLKGKVPEKWEGIAPEDSVLSLPELVKAKGKNWWVIRTARETLVYPFYGGEAMTTGKGNKAISADSEVVATDSGLRVVCQDGKQRTLKLN